MPVAMAKDGLLGALGSQTDIPIYVHTVNDADVAGCLFSMGAQGIYSDDLAPAELPVFNGSSKECSI